MFRPNITVDLHRRQDQMDIYGNQGYEPAVKVRCAIVSLDATVLKSSVRADSSASRGRAEEETVEAKLLFLPGEQIKQGDLVIVDGEQIEVITVEKRRNTSGKIDHLEVDFRRGARSL